MAIFMAIFMGGTPIGAPIVGWVANEFGPRWSLGVGAASGILAAAVGVIWLVKYQRVRVGYANRRFTIRRNNNAILAAERLNTEEITVQKG